MTLTTYTIQEVIDDIYNYERVKVQIPDGENALFTMLYSDVYEVTDNDLTVDHLREKLDEYLRMFTFEKNKVFDKYEEGKHNYYTSNDGINYKLVFSSSNFEKNGITKDLERLTEIADNELSASICLIDVFKTVNFLKRDTAAFH